jgi:hypothetical protein
MGAIGLGVGGGGRFESQCSIFFILFYIYVKLGVSPRSRITSGTRAENNSYFHKYLRNYCAPIYQMQKSHGYFWERREIYEVLGKFSCF